MVSALWSHMQQLLSGPAEEAATYIRCEITMKRTHDDITYFCKPAAVLWCAIMRASAGTTLQPLAALITTAPTTHTARIFSDCAAVATWPAAALDPYQILRPRSLLLQSQQLMQHARVASPRLTEEVPLLLLLERPQAANPDATTTCFRTSPRLCIHCAHPSLVSGTPQDHLAAACAGGF